MIDGLSEILITAIGSVCGTGGIAGIIFYRHNKKMRALEAQLKGAEVSKAKIESKADEWHLYREQLDTANTRIVELLKINAEKEDRHQQDIKDWEERFVNQTNYLRSVQRDLIAANEREKEHIRREGVLMRRIQYIISFICKRTNCEHGIPPRQHLKGTSFDDSQIAEVEAENNKTLTLIKND